MMISTVVLLVAVSAYSGYNGRRVLTIIADSMSNAGKRKVMVRHAKITHGCPDTGIVSNLLAQSSHWQLKANTNRKVRLLNDDFDKKRAGGRSRRWKYSGGFVASQYRWATNNLSAHDLARFKVIVVPRLQWMKARYTRIP